MESDVARLNRHWTKGAAACLPPDGVDRAATPRVTHRDTETGRTISISVGPVTLEGTLSIPAGAAGVVLFAHGSGSSRFSPRNQFVAGALRDAGVGTLLIDLLSPAEEAVDEVTRHHRFDIEMLAARLDAAIDWLGKDSETRDLPVGLFGASTGGGAALVAAANAPERVAAVVSRGGRPDLAAEALPNVKAPTLLIVGGSDPVVVDLNKQARSQMTTTVRLEIVVGATHLFEEPGALDEVARLASEWFGRYLRAARDASNSRAR